MTDIPVPPMADPGDAVRFHRMLLLHLARLKFPGERVGLQQFLLSQALSLHEPSASGGSCAECGQPSPCRTILHVALLSRFPVPWTPVTLAAALSTARLWPSQGPAGDVVSEDGLEWGDPGQYDPRYRAERDPRSGRWVVRARERGALRQATSLDGDDALCDFLLDQVIRRAFPYGWNVDESQARALADGAAAARQWWAGHGRLPYLENHRSDGAWQQDQH